LKTLKAFFTSMRRINRRVPEEVGGGGRGEECSENSPGVPMAEGGQFLERVRLCCDHSLKPRLECHKQNDVVEDERWAI